MRRERVELYPWKATVISANSGLYHLRLMPMQLPLLLSPRLGNSCPSSVSAQIFYKFSRDTSMLLSISPKHIVDHTSATQNKRQARSPESQAITPMIMRFDSFAYFRLYFNLSSTAESEATHRSLTSFIRGLQHFLLVLH